ncbi:MAG: hypothetical protein JWM77_898 [Rhodospirillales bacterium]|jgi:hypothetical protein|nr:hypothetical protein [Rhodospirillales bacterium]
MRLYILALAAAVSFAAPLKAEASPLAAPAGTTTVESQNVQLVAGRCGRHAHWVRGHRTRHHGYVRGRCVRNR